MQGLLRPRLRTGMVLLLFGEAAHKASPDSRGGEMPSLTGNYFNVISQKNMWKKEENKYSRLCSLLQYPICSVSSTAFLAGGHVAGTPSKTGRSLFYQATLYCWSAFIMLLQRHWLSQNFWIIELKVIQARTFSKSGSCTGSHRKPAISTDLSPFYLLEQNNILCIYYFFVFKTV